MSTPENAQPAPVRKRNHGVADSFKHASEGFIYLIRTQKHARQQLLLAVIAIALVIALQADRVQVVLVISAAVIVLLAEIYNTAIEVVVDMITMTYHPRAKVAKDVAAAGVLLASTYAVFVALGVILNVDFVHMTISHQQIQRILGDPKTMAIIALAVILSAIISIQGRPNSEIG